MQQELNQPMDSNVEIMCLLRARREKALKERDYVKVATIQEIINDIKQCVGGV